MKYTFAAIIGVVIIGVVLGVVMYQPYGECSALFDKIEENQELRDSLLEKIESEIHGHLRPSLETLVRNIVITELSDFENRMRDDFRCQLDALKFELNK